MRSTITSKGQVTIPVEIREKLDLKPGDILEFEADAPILTAYRVFEPEAMYALIGCRKHQSPDRTSEQMIEDMRGRVELPENDEDRD